MSLESALAILDKANAAQPMTPMASVDPNKAVLVEKSKEVSAPIVTEEKKDEVKPAESAAPKEETKPEIKEEEKPKENEADAKRFAMLAKKERALYQRDAELKSREAIVADKMRAIENFENFKLEARKNPSLALKELQVTYDDITQFYLKGEMPAEVQRSGELADLRQMVIDLKQELIDERENKKKTDEQTKQQQLQEAVEGFKQDISTFVDKNADKYELIKLNQLEGAVYNYVEQVFQKEKRILPIEDACDYIEDLVYKRNLEAKKFKQTAPKSDAQAPQTNKEKHDTQKAPTLNNQMTSSAPSFLPAKTEQERMQRAMAKLTAQ